MRTELDGALHHEYLGPIVARVNPRSGVAPALASTFGAAMDALDYPAAHSMDTSWFAVDEDGRVARFESSEDGAVPNNAATGGGAADPSFDTFALDAVRIARALIARAAKTDSAE